VRTSKAWTAAISGCPRVVGEQRENRSQLRLLDQQVAHVAGVADRVGVVRGSDVGQLVVAGHDVGDVGEGLN
jgi:hypothetical protein